MVEATCPRSEYPRPQLVRESWINLNGKWMFEIDQGKSGRERGLAESRELAGSILVPFCPESALSGVGHTDFMSAVWYKRAFELPASWKGGRVLLHFGAVDYAAEAWVNGISAGRHEGGYSSFSFDITKCLRAGSNLLTVCAEDDVRSGRQPRGKQSDRFGSYGCLYTRTTGIWQTVWLERVPEIHIASLRITPDARNGCVSAEALFNEHIAGGNISARVSLGGKAVAEKYAAVSGRRAQLHIELPAPRLWSPDDPCLYDLSLELSPDGSEPDRVLSYFGLRDVSWGGGAMHLNGKPLFQRLILDQGFYPSGIYTAPTDEELKNDILLGKAMGFNGARLHQKMFEERYLYWADRLGYLVWGEHASWGLDISGPEGLKRFLPEWAETLGRDYSHPCIVGWCPFNETHPGQDDAVLEQVYTVTKQLDRTRPVIDTSGYVHTETDIYDVHDYSQDVEGFASRYEELAHGEVHQNFAGREQPYRGQPYFVSEFGGIWWNPDRQDEAAWGYGERPASEEEFLRRFEGMVNALLGNPKVCAFCYTQLTDVEQEVNGLYTYDRKPKFDAGTIRRIVSAKAAVER